MGLSNAERQERWRIKRAKEVEELRKAAAKAKAASTASHELTEALKEIARLRQQLARAVGARQQPAKAVPQPVRWTTPTQVQRAYQLIMPKGTENCFLRAKWLPGHKDRVIEITVAPMYTGDPLEQAEQMLAELPGVYRIARIVGGSFGGEGDELRKQARALMAVTEPALKAEPTPGGWCGGVVVYDPRDPVT